MFYPTACHLPLQGLYIVSDQGGEDIPHNPMPPSLGLSLYAESYRTICVHSDSGPYLSFPSASCVPYATDLRVKHWPMDTSGLWT